MKPIFSPTKMLDSLILMQIVFEGPQHGYALAASIEEDLDGNLVKLQFITH